MKKRETIESVTGISSVPKRWGWIVHIIAWGMLLGFPFLFTTQESPHIPPERYLPFLTTILTFIVLFYANYAFLVKRFLFSRRIALFLAANLLLIVVLMVVGHSVSEAITLHFADPGRVRPPRPPATGLRSIQTIFMIVSFGIYWLVAALSVAFRMTGNWYTTEAERRELERSRSEAELQNLKSQLNPHFLFNTLNNIYSLIAFSPERAQDAVHELSRMLRYVMYDSNQPLVPLEKDLDFVKNYVELMRIRLPQHVEVEIDIAPATDAVMIAPLLFISLVENAFKHGVSSGKPSFIRIHIFRESNRVTCSILNSDFHKATEQDMSGSGIGLVNLQRRLSLLYPGRYTFEHGTEGENYRSCLSITVNDSAV